MRSSVVAVLVCLACACLPTVDVSPPPRCEVDGGLSTPSGRAVPIDQRATVVLSRKAPKCPPSLEVSLNAEVIDPTGAALPASFDGPFARGQFVTAEVHFTPTKEGLHRVQVDFSDGLGRAVNEVLAAARARLGERVSTIANEIECLREDATSRGAWVCLQPGSRASFWRAGRQLQVLPGDDVQVTDAVVWVMRAGELERFVDDGGDLLPRVPDLVLRPGITRPDEVVAASSDAIFVVSGQTIHPFVLTATRLEAEVPFDLPRGLCPEGVHLSPRSRSQLTITCGSRPGFVRQCAFDVANPSGARCAEAPGRLVGSSPAGMWTLIDAGQIVFTPSDGSPSVTRTLPSAFVVTSSHRLAGTFSPIVTDSTMASFVLEATALGVSVELLPEGLTVLGVGTDRVLLSGTSSRLITRLGN